MARASILSLLPIAALGLAGGCTPPEPDARPQRLILITVDTLRHDAFETGTGRDAMPHTRAVSRGGLIFQNAYASTSSTQPTHASLFTGRHPWQHGVTRNGMILAESEDTLAEQLARAGFATHAIVASFPLDPSFGFAQGFDAYEAPFDQAIPGDRWQDTTVAGGLFYALADTVTDRAIALLDEDPAARQFLWLHYFDPHDPYGDAAGLRRVRTLDLLGMARRKAPKLRATVDRAHHRYLQDVAALDTSLARLFERLARDRDRIDTHIVFTADHGESFGEGESVGHGQRLTPAEIRVPLFIVSDRVAPGHRRDAAGSVDVFATLLALADVENGTDVGRDLRAPKAVEAAAAFGMRRSYAEPHRDWRLTGSAVVLDGARFFAAHGDRILAGDSSEVVEDDDSERPVHGVESDAHRRLFGVFQQELMGATATEQLDAASQEALRALGYAR